MTYYLKVPLMEPTDISLYLLRLFGTSGARVSTPKETEDINVSLRCIGRAVHYHVFSCSFIFAGPSLVVGKAWKTKLTQQWICLFMENLMVQVASW